MSSKELVPIEYIDATNVTIVDEPVEQHSENALIDMWLHGKPAHTVRAYRHEVSELRKFLDKPLHMASIFDLQAYDTEKLMSKAPATRARAIAAIKSLYKKLLRAGLLRVNPAEFLDTPKLDHKQAERYLTHEQVDAIIAQAKTPRDRVMLNLFYHTGMRVSEIVVLAWKDILPTSTGATIEVFGKGSKPRQVYIDEEMYNELQSLPRIAACVFPSAKTGECMSTTQAQRIVVAAAERAGIDASPHYFRHAHASHLFEAGVNDVEIRDELGHSNIATTNKYAHSVGGRALGSVLRRK